MEIWVFEDAADIMKKDDPTSSSQSDTFEDNS
jgi:hypothetical protein